MVQLLGLVAFRVILSWLELGKAMFGYGWD
jgi:hypothetical protein